MVNFSIKARKLREWDALTASNAHGIRLEEIARYCVEQAERNGLEEAAAIFEAYAVDFGKVNRRHDAVGHLTMELYELRQYLRGRLKDNVRKYFGEDTEKLLDI